MAITMRNSGTLYLVATPIGNKEDITLRALQILKTVDVIAAEDTRHSKPLLAHYVIETPLISLHEFNEAKRTPALLERLQQGESVALISDAGTPLISDPGYVLVQAAREHGIQVTPIPGACALVTALCASGLPTTSFLFQGFLPTKSTERKRILEALQHENRTLIFYEAPHRILSSVQDVITVMGEAREIVLAKELTKTFETFFCGSAKQAYLWLEQDAHHQKGEFVILIHGAPAEKKEAEISEDAQRILDILCEELPAKQAVNLTARITGVHKNRLKAKSYTLPKNRNP